jgi:hypothetical protein
MQAGFFLVLRCSFLRLFSVTTAPPSSFVSDYPLKECSTLLFVKSKMLQASFEFLTIFPFCIFLSSFAKVATFFPSFYVSFLPFSSRQSFVSCVFAAPWFPESLMLFF